MTILPALAGAAFLGALFVVGADDAGATVPGWTRRPPFEHGRARWAGLVLAAFVLAIVLYLLRSLVERLLQEQPSARSGGRISRMFRPTLLPSTLRANSGAVEKIYGYDTALAWPRLEPLVSERVRARVGGWRQRYEVAVRVTATAVTGAVVVVAMLPAWPRGGLLLPAPLAVAWLGYRAAVRTAAGYGVAVRIAFDLHRFDLLAALHLPLPDTPATELASNRRLSESWAAGVPIDVVYRHSDVGPDVLDRVEDAVKGVLVPSAPVTFRGVVEVSLQGAEPVGERGNRQWQVRAGRAGRLDVTLIVGTHDHGAAVRHGQPADWQNPSALATEFLDVRGRSAPRVEVEIDIDAPFVKVTEPHRYLELASDEDVAVHSTAMVVERPGRYDLLVTLFSSGRLVQAVPVELVAVPE